MAGTFVQIASVGVNVQTYSNTGLTAGVRYWYRVRAYNTAGTSAYSNEANAMTQPPPPPGAPSALAANATSTSRIDLTWIDNATNEQGFRVERAPDAGGVAGTYTQIASVGSNVRTYSNTGLTGGTRYWYRVRAYNTAGNSAYSNEASATTSGPLAPTNLQAVAVSGAVVDLTWTDNAVDETSYRIQRAPDAGGVPGTWANLTTVGANVTTYRNTGRTPATTYWYRVRAENSAGNSAYTAGTSVTTMVQVAPSSLSANAYLVGTQRNVDLTWTPGTELTVDIYRNSTRLVSARVNDGGTYNTKPSATQSLPITYQVCVAGKTGAANCASVIVASF
ncbi:MAG TPA: fibronectin type III domain-containing protein [Gemmatimonadales bacterium]|nr:fibronectin type III domain-containing protein [Gemmatimonadales bacterium]